MLQLSFPLKGCSDYFAGRMTFDALLEQRIEAELGMILIMAAKSGLELKYRALIGCLVSQGASKHESASLLRQSLVVNHL